MVENNITDGIVSNLGSIAPANVTYLASKLPSRMRLVGTSYHYMNDSPPSVDLPQKSKPFALQDQGDSVQDVSMIQ